jgi:hypothetical protein
MELEIAEEPQHKTTAEKEVGVEVNCLSSQQAAAAFRHQNY